MCVCLRDDMILLYARRGGRPRCRWVITRLIVLRNNIKYARAHYTPVRGEKKTSRRDESIIRIVLFHFVAHIPFSLYYYNIFYFISLSYLVVYMQNRFGGNPRHILSTSPIYAPHTVTCYKCARQNTRMR